MKTHRILEPILEHHEDTATLMEMRKNDHIRICQTEDVESDKSSFESIELIPEALPEFHFDDIQIEQEFLGRVFSFPLLITGMTGGVIHGQKINEALARAAQNHNIPMGLGSQKMMLKSPDLIRLFQVRPVAPDVFLIGNIGAVSLNYGITPQDIVENLIKPLELNAFAVHLNVLQECIQPEGERNFSSLLEKIESLVALSPIPIIVKEVGSGISASTCQRLLDVGVSAIDVGGKGGTSWGFIEGKRSQEEGMRLGTLFRNWGYSTEKSITACMSILKEFPRSVPLIATGGMRHGIDMAKALALGATMVGVGLPLFRAAVSCDSVEGAVEAINKELLFFKRSLSIAMFCSGAKTIADLPSRIQENKKI
jgi:isopentenyl-diphosphate delta-isomerase